MKISFFRHQKIFFAKIRKALVFVLLALFLLAVAFSCWKFVRIKNINCHFDEIECPPKILGEVRGYFVGENIIFFSNHKAEKRLLETHFEFFSVRVNKKLPITLYVDILRRKPVAILLPARKAEVAADEISQEITNGTAALVDREGTFLDMDRLVRDLPAVISFQGMTLSGRKVEDEVIIKALDLSEKMLLRSLTPVSMVIITPREVKVRFNNGQLVIFSTEKEIIAQLDSLQYILSRAKMEGREIRKIDLRFAKPVIL